METEIEVEFRIMFISVCKLTEISIEDEVATRLSPLCDAEETTTETGDI